MANKPTPARPGRKGVSVEERSIRGVTVYRSRFTQADGRRIEAVGNAPDWTTAFVAACAKQDESERLSYRSTEGEKMKFAELVQDLWLPLTRAHADNTRKNILAHLGDGKGKDAPQRGGPFAVRAAQFALLNFFGHMAIGAIGPGEVRDWIAGMAEAGYKPGSMLAKRSYLHQILQYAVDQGWLDRNVVDATKVPTQQGGDDDERVLTPEEFAIVRVALGMAGQSTLLVADLTLDAGLRFEEVTGLRPMDVIDPSDDEPAHLHLRQAVAWPGVKHNRLNPGLPWQIKELKGKRDRKVAISPGIHARLLDYIDHHQRGADVLVFDYPTLRAEHAVFLETRVDRPRSRPHGRYVQPWTPGGPKPKSAEHGTYTAYTLGCHCPHCRNANNEYMFWRRRAMGVPMASPWKDPEYLRNREHIVDPVKYQWWAAQVWSAAVEEARLNWSPTFHNLRHCMVSWGYEGGATAAVLQAEAGHASMATTQVYQQRLDAKVSGARVAAMVKMYARMTGEPEPEPAAPAPDAARLAAIDALLASDMDPAQKAAVLVSLMEQQPAQPAAAAPLRLVTQP